MIAIPLSEATSTTISDLYGKAPYFALLDLETGSVRVTENLGCGDGEKTAKFITESGAKKTIFYHMGEKLFDYLFEKDISVYTSSKTFLTIDEIFKDLSKGRYKLLDKSSASSLLDSGNCNCTCTK